MAFIADQLGQQATTCHRIEVRGSAVSVGKPKAFRGGAQVDHHADSIGGSNEGSLMRNRKGSGVVTGDRVVVLVDSDALNAAPH